MKCTPWNSSKLLGLSLWYHSVKLDCRAIYQSKSFTYAVRELSRKILLFSPPAQTLQGCLKVPPHLLRSHPISAAEIQINLQRPGKLHRQQ